MSNEETESAKIIADAAETEQEESQDVKIVQTSVVVDTEVSAVVGVPKIDALGGVERDIVIEDGGAGSGFGVEENGGKGGKGTDLVLDTDVTESKKSGSKQNGGSLSDDERIKDGNEDEDRDEDDNGDGNVVDNGHEFEVGDFVWGKIKSHPWWPGVVYDENDASEFASKKKPANRLLVGYFGDGTFSWCHPSQLKPFVENFSGLSKMSQSKNFVNALQDTLDVMGRLLELEFDQSLPEENRRGLDRPLANNMGIKEDVLVPEGGIHKFSFLQYEANRLIADLKSVAVHSSAALNMLELTLLKSFLSAFYHAKGGYQLPSYIAPQPILGLEDKTKNEGNKKREHGYSVDTSARGPSIDDWQSSPSQSALNKLAETSGGKSAQKRKQKSIADILRDNTEVKASSTGRRKRKSSDVSDTQNSTSPSSKPKRRKKVLAEASTTAGYTSMGKKDQAVDRSKLEPVDGSMSAKKTMIRVLNIRSEDSETDEQTGRDSHSREKKKSKYLSPPFTSPSRSEKNKALEAESIRVSSRAHLGERMTRAATSLMNRSPGSKNDSEADQMEDVTVAEQSNSYPTTPKQTETAMNIQVSANEVLSGVQSAACDPTRIGNDKDFGFVKEYLSAFRNSVYSGESDEKVQKSRAGRKRKAADVETVQMGNNLLEPKDDEASLLDDDVVKEKISLISSMAERLDRENVLELKPKLIAEIEAVKEKVAALTGPSS